MDYQKLIKKQIIKEASSNPQKYFPVKMLEQLGFTRQKCSKCNTQFWSQKKRNICGDTNCVGKYTFIKNTPAKKKFEFTQVYLEWKKFIEKRGYTHVNRFPIVARWRDDLDFNIASIIGFQPYVTKGTVKPPHELLTIPQNCMRFSDIDNIGYTGRHFTGFTMIGQCAFKEPQKYDQAKYLKDLIEFFTTIIQIPIQELQIHEDAWLGGGDCGPSLEIFSCGLELANQVYMWYDMSLAKDISQIKPLKIKVLDMGMGQERICWFSKASLNAYDACMPKVTKYLFEKTNLKPNWEIYKKFLPYSGMLNLDEVDDIEKAWENIAEKINIDVHKLKKEVEELAGIYSIADHTRSLLYALNDGALPSNVKGGYNLRLILRRALDFIYKFKWEINLFKIIKLHAQELNNLYPELEKNLKQIEKIINLEVEKYKNHKEKVENKINKLIKKNQNLTEKDFIKFYISDGIMPDEIKKSFLKSNKKINIPNNFFTLVNQYFENQKQSNKKKIKNRLSEFIKDLPKTKLLFYEDKFKKEDDIKILKEFEFENNKYLVLDKTLFYPTMGGQASDKGFIGDKKVIEVLNIENVIIHKIDKK